MNKNWEHIQFFHQGDEFFAELLSEIRRAQKSIWLEFYIFEIDPLTNQLLLELQMAVLRGCEVRLMVDGVGSLFYLDALEKRCQREGIQFRIYHPLPNFLQWLARFPEEVFAKSKTPGIFRRANRRNHRKTTVIDGKTSLLGSFNMTRVHYAQLMGKAAWRDSGVKLIGPPTEALCAAFDIAWTFAKRPPLLTSHRDFLKERIQTVLQWHDFFRLNVNDRIRRHLFRDLCRRIHHAQHRVYVTTAYFLPQRAVARALSKAAKRGVDVRLLTPGPSDVPLVKWAAYLLPYKLEKAGVRIFEYQPSVLHAKYMIIDNWCSLGSFNLNHRSVLHDLEVEAIFTDSEIVLNLLRQFELDLQNSLPLQTTKQEQVWFWQRWIAKILFKLRYWF